MCRYVLVRMQRGRQLLHVSTHEQCRISWNAKEELFTELVVGFGKIKNRNGEYSDCYLYLEITGFVQVKRETGRRKKNIEKELEPIVWEFSMLFRKSSSDQ